MDIVSVPGRLVRDPVTRRVVDATPITINPSEPYWARLLADGDVVEAPAEQPAPVPAEEAPPADEHPAAATEVEPAPAKDNQA